MNKFFPLIVRAPLLAVLIPMGMAAANPWQALARVCPAHEGDVEPPDFQGEACETRIVASIDPQGRHLWIELLLDEPDSASNAAPVGVAVSGKAAALAFLNGVALGANGLPADRAEDETPGAMDFVFPIPGDALNAKSNRLTLRMSSHRGWLHLRNPLHGIGLVHYLNPQDQLLRHYLPAFAPLGALLIAAVYFGLVVRTQRRVSALWLGGLSMVASLQLLMEVSRGLVAYAYPTHDLRLIGILLASCLFSFGLVGIALHWFASRRVQWPALTLSAVSILAATWLSSGMDGKATMALMTAAAICIGVSAYATWRGVRGSLAFLIAVSAFASIIAWTPDQFLDAYFYYWVAALVLYLLIHQVRAHASAADDASAQRRRADELESALKRQAQDQRAVILSVAGAGSMRQVAAERIRHIQGAGDYVELHLDNGEVLLHLARLNDLEAQLPSQFLRVHRSHIVNSLMVERLQSSESGGGKLTLRHGKSIPVSRKSLPGVRRALRMGEIRV